jgi:membrane-associated protein
MESIIEFVTNFFVHLDEHLVVFVNSYGIWVYGLLFLIIFAETGFVVTPFLPGDSLLFATGAIAARGDLNIFVAVPLFLVAAIGGDAVNYAVGHYVGPRVFTSNDRTSLWRRLLNRNHLMEAHNFYERHGGKAVILGRFVPIVRTFVPFVAGCGSMSYPQFALYNVIGAFLWVGICVGAGFIFGQHPFVKEHFEIVVIAIIGISVLPIVWGYLINRFARTPTTKIDSGIE